MEKKAEEFLKMKHFAVFGVSDRRSHPGFKMVRRMVKRGYRVYPINPRIAKLQSMRCYGTLDELPVVPEVVVCALPPAATLEVIRSGVAHGVRRFWIQPGSESESVLSYLDENGLTAVHSECIYRELGKSCRHDSVPSQD